MTAIPAPPVTADDALRWALRHLDRQLPEWVKDHKEICRLARWLNDRDEFGTGRSAVGECIYFFSKPWKWDNEYKQMEGMNANPPTHGECECGAITDNKDSHARWECDGCRNLRED